MPGSISDMALLGEKPILSASLIELARWMSNYYCCPVETVMRSLLPQVIRSAKIGWKKKLFVSPARSVAPEEIEKLRRRAPRQAELLEAIAQLPKPMPASDLLRRTSLDNSTLRALIRRGFAELREQAVERDPHVCAKRDFVRGSVQKIGQRRSRFDDNGVSLDAGGKRPVSIGVVVEQIVAHRIHDRGGNLGAAGSVEVGDWFLTMEAS